MLATTVTAPPTKRRKRGVAAGPQLLTLADLDQRTRAAMLARQLRDDLASDLGGDPTAGQRALLDRTATLHAILSDHEARWLRDGKIDLSSYLAAGGEFRRLCMAVGIAEREAKPVNGPSPSARFYDAPVSG